MVAGAQLGKGEERVRLPRDGYQLKAETMGRGAGDEANSQVCDRKACDAGGESKDWEIALSIWRGFGSRGITHI